MVTKGRICPERRNGQKCCQRRWDVPGMDFQEIAGKGAVRKYVEAWKKVLGKV